jgi:uncharacterized protein
MLFEWDESKNRSNRQKHSLDFSEAADLDWEAALVADRTREDDGERRYAAIGLFRARLHTVVFTRRGSRIRVISFRKSNRAEGKAYESIKSKTAPEE